MAVALSMKEQIKQVQRNLHTRPDGSAGRHTWNCFYLATTPKDKVQTPYAIRAFGEWLLIAKPDKSFPFDPHNTPLRYFKNTVSGTFSWAGKPISIMINGDEVIRDYSCHYWAGKLPESVLCYYKDGTHDVQRVYHESQLKRRDEIQWAIGGAGMGEHYAPKEEGFSTVHHNGKKYYFGDVWRDTSHIIIGFDRFGYLNIGFVTNQNYKEMMVWIKNVGMIDCILLDGGHITAVNMDDVKYNVNTRQKSVMQLG